MNDSCKFVEVMCVIQENGIIRKSDGGSIIARLNKDVSFNSLLGGTIIMSDRALLEDMAKFIETVMQGPPNGLNNLQQWEWDIEQQQIGERIIASAKERLGK